MSFLHCLVLLLIGWAGVACQPSTSEKVVQQVQAVSTSKPKTRPVQKSTMNPSDHSSASSAISPTFTEHLAPVLLALENGDTVRIVCYGNSITNGYKVGTYGQVARPYPEVLEELLRKHYQNPAVMVRNEGHNGWKSNQALAQASALVLTQKPDLVLIEFGINDAYSNFSVPVFIQNIQQLVQLLRQNGARVLLLAPTPIHTSYEAKVQAYTPALARLAEQEKIAFFHLHQALLLRLKKEALTMSQMLPDDVHLADDYYAWIAEAVFQFFLSF